MPVTIEVIRGPDKGRVFQVGEEGVIGRESESLALNDGTVSRRHARVSRPNGEWLIEDVGSANGTFLNGARVTRPSPLHLGDQIRCGTTLLVFGGPAGKAPPLETDEGAMPLDAAIVARVPASDDSVIIPTPEAGIKAIDNLRILYDLTTELSSIFDLDMLFQRAVDIVFKVVQADHAFIILIDKEGRLATRAARYRLETSGPSGTDKPSTESTQPAGPLPVSKTIINEVVTRQVGILSSNAMQDKRFGSGKSVHEYGIRSAICVPIKARDRIIGVIHVDCSVSDHIYSTEQLRLLTAIGYQTGLATENVRLYEDAVKSERLAATGQTVALLSHHIKNILQALGGSAELVEKFLAENNSDGARQTWPVVRRSLDQINALILNMLAFSKRRQPLLESVDANAVIAECLDMLTPRADEREVALMTDLNDLPPVPADPAGLQQALLNLLTNALDAVRDRTGVITVSSEYDSMNRRVIVRVADNGVGIEPDEIGRIFDLFHSTKGHKGTGLGLAVAKKVITEHGGKIEVASTPGEGTTFTVTLSTQPTETRSHDDTHTP